MTRAESLARQSILRQALIAAGWKRRAAAGNEFWCAPDAADGNLYTFEEALRHSPTAQAHPYWKSVTVALAKGRRIAEKESEFVKKLRTR